MSSSRFRSRLFVDYTLDNTQSVSLASDQIHYLGRVMRVRPGDGLLLFNGVDGEWLARVVSVGRSSVELRCEMQTRKQEAASDIWLLFAPLKKARTDFAVEKATEIGVSRIVPVASEFTNSRRISKHRLRAVAREAAEQCGGLSIPEISELSPLKQVLSNWPMDRRLLFCDEAAAGVESDWDSRHDSGGWAILTGPEGGFSPGEREWLRALRFTKPMSLGHRILRAETAASVALALLHGFLRQNVRQ